MIQTRFGIALWNIETAPYRQLDLRDVAYPHWILSHVLQGDVTTMTSGEEARAWAGDVMIHPPHLPFSERATGAGIHQWMLFDASLTETDASVAPLELLLRFPLPMVVSLGERKAAFAEVFEALRIAWETSDNAPDDLRVAGLAGVLLSEVIGAWREAGGPPRPATIQTPRGRFAETLRYMEQNLAARLTREDLARRAFLHPGSFDRAFRAAHGTPPMRLLLEMRLARARRLLETTNDTLDAIARACGLGDAPRFSRHFRARYGLAPGAYRAQICAARVEYIPHG